MYDGRTRESGGTADSSHSPSSHPGQQAIDGVQAARHPDSAEVGLNSPASMTL